MNTFYAMISRMKYIAVTGMTMYVTTVTEMNTIQKRRRARGLLNRISIEPRCGDRVWLAAPDQLLA